MNLQDFEKLVALSAGGEIMALGVITGLGRLVDHFKVHPGKGPTAVLDNENELYLSGDHSELKHFVMVMRIAS